MVKSPDVVSASPSVLDQRLPEALKAAAKLLATDLELSTTDTWQPVLRVAGTTFQSTATLIGHIKKSVITIGSRQLLYNNLFDVISLICNILSQDCPTILGVMRFLKRLMEAANDISHSLGIARPSVELAKASTLKLWLETIGSELQTVLSLLREDTLVFTCPFPLAGCTYQTTDMQQWTSHMNICRGQRLVSRRFEPVETRACEELDLRSAKHALVVATLEITDLNRTIWRHSNGVRHLRRVTELDPFCHASLAISIDVILLVWWFLRLVNDIEVLYKCFLEALYRSVWLELLRPFGLCMLSVMPLRTNMLGFVACWLTILRSVSIWKRQKPTGGFGPDFIALWV